MIIAFVVRKLPYTVRSGSAFLQQMDPSVEEASISLGVSPMQTFIKVTARLMAPGVLSGAILSWITCINECYALRRQAQYHFCSYLYRGCKKQLWYSGSAGIYFDRKYSYFSAYLLKGK